MRRSAWVRAVTRGSRGLGDRGVDGHHPGFSGRMARHPDRRPSDLLCAAQAELDDQSPMASVSLLRRQFEQSSERTAKERLANWAQRVEHNKGLYITRTVGVAAILIGLNMFIMHQL